MMSRTGMLLPAATAPGNGFGEDPAMDATRKLLFLPGASGAAEYWRPVADRLPDDWHKTLLNWPGAGDEPYDPQVRSFDDLVARASAELGDQHDIVAHSMGGAVAIGLAVCHPEKVRRLVLVTTSGGIDLSGLGAADWRNEYRAEYPQAMAWISQEQPDYSRAITQVSAPTLLVFGDADPLSPVSIGERLAALLPGSVLHVVAGANHSVAREHPDEVARLIIAHLQ
jgi:pimeloyl-ACP methyl ester carboxylesterase